jgi:hypothetical protein
MTPGILAGALFAGSTLIVSCATPVRTEPAPHGVAYEVRNGKWLGPDGFRSDTRYVVDARLSLTRPAVVDSVIDAEGGWIVPPYGEAHNHNVSYTTAARTDSLLARYMRDGVFYALNPGDLPRGRDSLAGRVNRPGMVDAAFANGLLTATGGHPIGVYLRNLARGGMTAADGDEGFLWLIDSLPDLERKWPRILAGHPDIIKTVLVHSEEFARRRGDTAFFNWRGLDPALLPEIARRAHAAGLRMMTHVETAADFRAAVGAGADVIAHIPGFRGNEHARIPSGTPYEISAADAREAARRGTWVVTTLGGISPVDPHGPDSLRRQAFDRLAARNLRVLRDAGVHIAIGSDEYRDDSANEIRYIAALGVFDPLTLVRLWSESTPRAIFSARRVGCLSDGCEASFLVLRRDPSLNVGDATAISLRVKDGHPLQPRPN